MIQKSTSDYPITGYECTIVTPDKNSDEKMNTMNLLGAKVIQTPAMAPWDSPESFVSVTKRILENESNAICCDQVYKIFKIILLINNHYY